MILIAILREVVTESFHGGDAAAIARLRELIQKCEESNGRGKIILRLGFYFTMENVIIYLTFFDFSLRVEPRAASPCVP